VELNFDSRKYLKRETEKFAIGVFGSRSLRDERVYTIILEKIRELNATKIITCQEPQGVSEVAQRVAKQYGYPLQVHFLNMQYLRGAFEQRSKEIISEADFFIVIHDGESKGTANELALVKKSGKPYHYEILEKSQYERSVGFNISKDWDSEEETEIENWNEIGKINF
jgi:predicted SpoU family rRNA methylase